jgi:putative endonuclease
VKDTWFLYLLECEGGRLYTGISTDVAARFDKHRRGKGAMFTRLNRPVRLLGAKAFGSRSEALKAEWTMKRLTADQKRQAVSQWGTVPGVGTAPE